MDKNVITISVLAIIFAIISCFLGFGFAILVYIFAWLIFNDIKKLKIYDEDKK